MRIGVVGLLHESNTFVEQSTTLAQFEQGVLLEGPAIHSAFDSAHHEIGGMLGALASTDNVETVPLFVARAMPSGVIEAAAFEQLVHRMLCLVDEAGPLDGILAAPHGATVSETEPDADGAWLYRLRQQVGDTPIVATLDAHANLSARMVEQCNALVAYRTNPHLDQRARGDEAAKLLLNHVRERVGLAMAALMPPLAINIEKQCTDDPHFLPLLELAQRQRDSGEVISNSILLGFPYADVAEMGSAVLAVGNSQDQATQAARQLAGCMWDDRRSFEAQLIGVEESLEQSLSRIGERTCLLDMGDNIGGGSAGDGTFLLAAINRRRIADSFVCIFDPESVGRCKQAGLGADVELVVGGKTDGRHGEPVALRARVRRLPSGEFRETAPRHGGITRFDQGDAAVVETDYGMTLLLNSRRTAPFSLNQLISCGIDPNRFRILVAKGVNAPVAAYREVCSNFIRVNTSGSTSADLQQLDFIHRRRPMFPFESDTDWSASEQRVVCGYQRSVVS